jgi:glycine cleavage system regulatory protein
MNVQIMVTISGSNHVNLIKALSDKSHTLGGKWINSKISYIDDYIAGLIKIEVNADNVEKLISGFKSLNIKVDSINLGTVTHEKLIPFDLNIDGKDRPGLIHNITQVLSDNSIHIDNMECSRLGMPAIGDILFTGHFKIVVDEQFNKNALVSSLQAISEDLIIDLRV